MPKNLLIYVSDLLHFLRKHLGCHNHSRRQVYIEEEAVQFNKNVQILIKLAIDVCKPCQNMLQVCLLPHSQACVVSTSLYCHKFAPNQRQGSHFPGESSSDLHRHRDGLPFPRNLLLFLVPWQKLPKKRVVIESWSESVDNTSRKNLTFNHARYVSWRSL